MTALARTIKRLIDLLVAGFGLLALSPVLLLLCGLNLIAHGWPPFFTQQRPGLQGRPFRMVKFRTMTNARDARGDLLPDAERLTPFGRWLRATSLDELPELWNVLRGDMSLVGPRPLLMRYLPRYSPRQARRHDVRPGVTGLAQISGRNALDWETKLELDVRYVETWSLLQDFHILWRTFATVVRREGISAAGDATMPEFTGSPAGRAPAQDS